MFDMNGKDTENDNTPSVQLASVLLSASLCSNLEEAQGIAEAIIEDITSSQNEEPGNLSASFRETCVCELEDYFAIRKEEATALVTKAFVIADNQEDSDALEDDEINSQASEEEDYEEENEEEILIGDGECELCERYIQLSRHHLIPKSTHSRMKPRLAHAFKALQKGEVHKANTVLGDGLDYLIPLLSNGSTDDVAPASLFRSILNTTCNVCRPCHSAIHRAHDNVTLAEEYSTVQKLLGDENVYKFCKWASKQRAGKYALR
mmetsp:Transcript_14469/g.20402  ORF Transcript_14469/g.20402 Transcript_14469/m.20402 type:complete len:263 (+) Transcript_14469:308-1096(+)